MSEPTPSTASSASRGGWERLVGWLLDNRLVVAVLVGLLLVAGLRAAPFDWGEGLLPRDPLPVDAIPDVGENQQIVFTEWPGRSPRDIEDQITYPLTTALLGMPGVRTVRSASAFGFSTLYVIFEDDVEFYWSRSRVLEKLASLPPGALPEGVAPTLGPDATALGQVFWYTLEGRDPEGRVVGGWDPDELRSIQDWTVRYALQAVSGVSEVASVGGFVREYQVDVDPDAMRAARVSLAQVVDAVRSANLDTGARTLEVNGVEYVVRGLGFVRSLEDLEAAVVVTRENTPIRVRDVAHVTLGPALRRGALDDAGAPAVGGVVVARFRENPLGVIARVKEKIAQIQPGLPRRTLEDGSVSQVRIVPFYDRTTLIEETLGTLSTALSQQLLITVVVVLLMLWNLRSSLLISAVLPLAVLLTFVVMKHFGVDANVMALGGIAIAIGSMVDMGIVFVENAHEKLREAPPGADRAVVVRRATAEVAPAVMTSVATTVVSFLPVFGLAERDLRLFGPLALTKTFAMGGALLLALVILPSAALLVLGRRPRRAPPSWLPRLRAAVLVGVLFGVTWVLAAEWLPLGPGAGTLANVLAVALVIALLMGSFRLFERAYPALLSIVLRHKAWFLCAPALVCLLGTTAWLGFDRVFGFLPDGLEDTRPARVLAATFPGLGREYMPAFDEGSFLFMPSTMPHASIGEAQALLSDVDAAIAAVPEVTRVVGKLGRAQSALDPAPLSMFEIVVHYTSEYGVNAEGERVRKWRDHVRSPGDIWDAIARAAARPGLTSAPRLMPIEARLVMLQSGMRAPMGFKIRGPSLAAIESFGMALEPLLKQVPELRSETVFADRVVGKPYLEIVPDRVALGRYGLSIVDVQRVLQVALGGETLTRTVEGRERYPVRVRYMREERDSLESLERVFVPTPEGESVPLGQVAQVRYVRGPQVIKSEDTFLTSYVLFDRVPEVAEVDAAEKARARVIQALATGELTLPDGVSYELAGSYQNQLQSEERLRLLVPVALALVFILLYLQFHRVSTCVILYTGVLVSVAGGFCLLWLYGQPWFLDGAPFGVSLRALFQVGTVHLSVAVWIGMLALVGIATDDGVVMCTFLDQRFRDAPPESRDEVRARTLEAGVRRVRPCLMTTATTLLALLPVITSQGRGADLMLPLALPSLGGMAIELMSLFVVPVLYCAREERRVSTT